MGAVYEEIKIKIKRRGDPQHNFEAINRLEHMETTAAGRPDEVSRNVQGCNEVSRKVFPKEQ